MDILIGFIARRVVRTAAAVVTCGVSEVVAPIADTLGLVSYVAEVTDACCEAVSTLSEVLSDILGEEKVEAVHSGYVNWQAGRGPIGPSKFFS